MNIVLNPNYFCKNTPTDFQNCICFLDTKENNIMIGEFTKLIFTNDFITLNGIYLLVNLQLQIEKKNIEKQKSIYKFQTTLLDNIQTIHELIQIEQRLLEYYVQHKNTKKRAHFVLQKQLMNGFLHYYKENGLLKKKQLILKISGIWESINSFGITYKFIEY